MISIMDNVPTYSLKLSNSQHNDPGTNKEFTNERNDQINNLVNTNNKK